MSRYVLTPLAIADIFQIWSYIAQDNIQAANRVEDAIYDACEMIAENPSVGHSCAGITTRFLRFWTLVRYSNYTLVYRPDTKPVEIVAVLHGRRNITSILRGRL
jgi:plasmid stabilization system protein ParE